MASPTTTNDADASTSKYNAWAWVLIGLLGIPLLAFGVAALVLPPGIAFGLVTRGLRESRTVWVVLGASTGLVWLLILFLISRRVFGRQGKDAAS